jgi:hypothetical protein
MEIIMNKNIGIIYGVMTLALFASCGSISSQPADEATSVDTASADSAVVMFATDFSSSGQLYEGILTDGITELGNSGVSDLGSSGIVRASGEQLYILHDGYSFGSSDNIQILDAATFVTEAQYSLGNGANPHDVVVTGDTAYVSIYNAAFDPDNTDVSGNPADVVEIDLATGEIIRRYSFSDFLNDDGDKLGRADQMVLVGGILYVALQDSMADFSVNAPGLIGMIDIVSKDVEGVMTLQTKNPVDIVLGSDGDRLFVASAEYDTSGSDGGLEVLDRSTGESLFVVDDEDLGGYLERLATDNDGVYAVASTLDADFNFSSKVMRLSADATDASSITTIDDAGSDVREILVTDGHLWISRREINQATGVREPRVDVIDLATEELLGESMIPAAPVTSMVALP